MKRVIHDLEEKTCTMEDAQMETQSEVETAQLNINLNKSNISRMLQDCKLPALFSPFCR
jgi:hypothetical protein